MATARVCSPGLLEMEDRWLPTHTGRKLDFLGGRASALGTSAAPAVLGSSGPGPYLFREKALLRLDFFSWDFLLHAGAGF